MQQTVTYAVGLTADGIGGGGSVPRQRQLQRLITCVKGGDGTFAAIGAAEGETAIISV